MPCFAVLGRELLMNVLSRQHKVKQYSPVQLFTVEVDRAAHRPAESRAEEANCMCAKSCRRINVMLKHKKLILRYLKDCNTYRSTKLAPASTGKTHNRTIPSAALSML